MTQFVVWKTALYVQIDNIKPAYIFVILLKITINIILNVLFAIINYQLLCVFDSLYSFIINQPYAYSTSLYTGK